MSSSLGSLALDGDPTSDHYAVRLIGYNASKDAPNMMTVALGDRGDGGSARAPAA